jgi:hypothetical protein
LIKSFLSNRIITPSSSVSVGKFFSAGNIEKVLILETKPDGEALTVSAKTTQVKIENIITNKWMKIQERVQSTRLGGVDEVYNKLKELVVYPLQHPDVEEFCYTVHRVVGKVQSSSNFALKTVVSHPSYLLRSFIIRSWRKRRQIEKHFQGKLKRFESHNLISRWRGFHWPETRWSNSYDSFNYLPNWID